MNADTNEIIVKYLNAQAALTDIVGARIYCPRMPENAALPAVGLFTRGGTTNPHIPGLVGPSVQFDCWGADQIAAREVYRALYDVLQGIQRQVVSISGTDYIIWSAIEEVTGQDLQDPDIPGYFRVLAFFSMQIKAI